MRRPSFQFYPADWRANANLRRCSWAARGAWVEIIGLMHDSDEYGVLRWPLAEIAHSLGCSVKLLKELAEKNVLKGADQGLCGAYVHRPRHAGQEGEPVELVKAQAGPVWYSSRMVLDEHNRLQRGKASRFEKQAPKAEPKPPPKPHIGGVQGDGASSSSASSSSKEESVSFGNGAGCPKPPAGTDLFSLGKELLSAQGMPVKDAGSFLGKLRSQHGDDAVMKALLFAQEKKPSDLRSWLVKTAPAMKQKVPGVDLGSQNYGAGWGVNHA